MSLVVAKRGRMRWEIELGKALEDFENSLSPEQRAGFQAVRDHAACSPPTIRDVMNLTAEVDLQARHRCFGPRFTRILESVQQYAGIGDVVVGGSQNLIACGVWSLVRMSLLSAPLIQDMASLFPHSKPLQDRVAHYFTTVVRVCQKSIKLCQPSIIGQMRLFIQDGDVSRYESELALQATAIKEQLQLEHTRTTSSVYNAIRSLSEAYKSGKDTENHHRLLDLCSTYNYKPAWKRLRKLGTTESMLVKGRYKHWLSGEQPKSLIVRGKLGSGKSVLLANMVDDVNLKYPKRNTAYFFCCEDELRSLSCRTIMGCFARQLLEPVPAARTAEQSDLFFEDMGTDQIIEALFATAETGEGVVLILDGLESCARQEIWDFLDSLQRLQKVMNVAVCISWSVEAGNDAEIYTNGLARPQIATLPDDRPEIGVFIKGQLLEKVGKRRSLPWRSRTYLGDRTGSQQWLPGMFLWAHLQIEAICLEKSDASIRHALRSLPRSLPEIYQRILDRRKRFAAKYQIRALQLMGAALRPLSKSEFEDSISVVSGNTNITKHRINDVGSVLASCGSLIVLDEEQHTLHFTHHSVKRFLLGQFRDEQDRERFTGLFSETEANSQMGQVIVTYLNWKGFNGQVSQAVAPSLPVGSMPTRIIGSISEQNKKLRTLAVNLLNGKMKPVDLDIDLVPRNSKFNSLSVDYFSFLKYARDYWLHHTKNSDDASLEIFDLFQQLVFTTELVDKALLWKEQPPSCPNYASKESNWAKYHDHQAMLKAYSTYTAVEELFREEGVFRNSLETTLISEEYSLHDMSFSAPHAQLDSPISALEIHSQFMSALETIRSRPPNLERWDSFFPSIERQFEQLLQHQHEMYDKTFDVFSDERVEGEALRKLWVLALSNRLTKPTQRVATGWNQLREILQSSLDPLVRSTISSNGALMFKISSMAETLSDLALRLEQTQDLVERTDKWIISVSQGLGKLQISGTYGVITPSQNPQMCEIYIFEAYMLVFGIRRKQRSHPSGSKQLRLEEEIKLATLYKARNVTHTSGTYDLQIHWTDQGISKLRTIEFDTLESLKQWEAILKEAIHKNYQDPPESHSQE
ncbi:hypothetical protein PG987_015468 [Apiospora arundinis]